MSPGGGKWRRDDNSSAECMRIAQFDDRQMDLRLWQHEQVPLEFVTNNFHNFSFNFIIIYYHSEILSSRSSTWCDFAAVFAGCLPFPLSMHGCLAAAAAGRVQRLSIAAYGGQCACVYMLRSRARVCMQTRALTGQGGAAASRLSHVFHVRGHADHSRQLGWGDNIGCVGAQTNMSFFISLVDEGKCAAGGRGKRPDGRHPAGLAVLPARHVAPAAATAAGATVQVQIDQAVQRFVATRFVATRCVYGAHESLIWGTHCSKFRHLMHLRWTRSCALSHAC